MMSCAETVTIETVRPPDLPVIWREPVPLAPITETDDALAAVQGVHNMRLQNARLISDRAAVNCVWTAAEARAEGQPAPECLAAYEAILRR